MELLSSKISENIVLIFYLILGLDLEGSATLFGLILDPLTVCIKCKFTYYMIRFGSTFGQKIP